MSKAIPAPHRARNRLSIALFAALLPIASLANAQQNEDPASDAKDEKKSAASRTTELERITVTGTRIPRAGFDTLEPATVVSRDRFDDFGFTNAIDALVDLPSFSAGASIRGDQSSFGTGVSFLSRFGLGSNRMLTLVNGRRFVTSNPPTIFGPAGGGIQVDLNAIPTILIDRIETLGIGGAPTYGSDAISGVTNILLRENFDGARVEIGYGLTERGDNARYYWASLIGANFADDRGNITIAASYDNNDGVLSTERAFYRNSYSLQTNPTQAAIDRFQPGRNPATDGRVNRNIPFNTGSSDGIPGSVFIRNRRINYMTWGGVVMPDRPSPYRDASGQLAGFGPGNALLHFDSQGNLLPYNVGTTFGNGNSSGGDGLNLSETSQIISDLGRKSIYALGHFDFTDNIRGFAEASWFNSNAREIIDQNVYNAIGFGRAFVDGRGAQSGSLNFNINNPFLSEQARQQLQALGVSNFRLSRSSRDLSTNNASSESTITRVVAGLQGLFDWGGRGFEWEASVVHGRGDFDYYGTGLIQQNFINAINVTRDASGRIICDASAPGTVFDPACRPLNLFGEGVASADAKAYVSTPTHATATMRQTVFNANLTGGMLDLPGGELGFNLGYEHRREEGGFQPSEYQRLGQGRAVPIEAVNGSFHTDELFTEVLAPLVDPDRGLWGLHRLDLTGKLRRVRNSVNGWFTSYTYGLQYEPIAGLQLRGNKTQSFRAPSISELYTSQQPAFFSIPEACTLSNIGSGKRPDVRRRNCEAFFTHYGVDPSTFQGASTTQLGSRNGNPGLDNEKADSWTAGLVFQPEWASGLRMAADWYDIKITQAITAESASDIVVGCFDNEQFNAADVPNANRFCSRISRDPLTGVANGIATSYLNGPVTQFRGWTSEVDYRLQLDRFSWGKGRLDLGFNGYFPKQLASSPATDIPLTESVGTIGVSKRQFNWFARYLLGNWRFRVDANYLGPALVSRTNTVETRDFLRADSWTMWNASIGYKPTANLLLNLAVLNVGDDIGPFPFVYDALGRRYMMTASYNF